MRSRDEIRVRVSLSLSGEFQLQGQDTLRGLRFWVDYVERDGGIALGHSGSRRSPRLIVYDGSKTERAEDNPAPADY
jgi:ABC-type branched-subunit amino acid transport system substrate-binding protein